MHYITLDYITLHWITLHWIALHYITLHHITLHSFIYVSISLNSLFTMDIDGKLMFDHEGN